MKKINIFKINCQKIKILKIKHGATKNFAVVKPLNSGEALASLASPVPTPLNLLIYCWLKFEKKCNLGKLFSLKG